MIAHPPEWAQWLVSNLVPARTRDSVLGDLLEEYRDSQMAERGKAAADAWYVRQALAFLWRAAHPIGLALAGNLSGRLVCDLLFTATARDLYARSLITTFLAMAFFVWFGFRLGQTTGRTAGAAVAALAGTVIATLYAYVFVLACMGAALLLTVDAGVWSALLEGLDIPVPVLAAIGLALSTAAATIGRMFTGSSGSRASIRT
jgi:hypothetical protein